MQRMLKLLLTALLLAGAGCAGTGPRLSAEYFAAPTTLAITVTGCPAAPTLFADLGHRVNATQTDRSRARTSVLSQEQAMRSLLRKITADQVEAAVAAALARQLDGLFTVVATNARLALKVEIDSWGWNAQPDRHSQDTRSYRFRIAGTTAIRDLGPVQRGAHIFYEDLEATVPLGTPPTAEQCQAGLPQAAAQFARQVDQLLRQGQAP